jgi:outer membrane protein TolC
LSYGIEQKLPLFGKPGAMRKMAAAELAVEVADEDMKFQLLRRDLAKALFRAALADEMLVIAEQDLEWIAVTTKVVEEGYRSGSARLMDVLTLQNEQSKRRRAIADRPRQSRPSPARGEPVFESRFGGCLADVATAAVGR